MGVIDVIYMSNIQGQFWTLAEKLLITSDWIYKNGHIRYWWKLELSAKGEQWEDSGYVADTATNIALAYFKQEGNDYIKNELELFNVCNKRLEREVPERLVELGR